LFCPSNSNARAIQASLPEPVSAELVHLASCVLIGGSTAAQRDVLTDIVAHLARSPSATARLADVWGELMSICAAANLASPAARLCKLLGSDGGANSSIGGGGGGGGGSGGGGSDVDGAGGGWLVDAVALAQFHKFMSSASHELAAAVIPGTPPTFLDRYKQ
jgi:uncharacterized membrane protein YgcG